MSLSFQEILPQLIERRYNVIWILHDASKPDVNPENTPTDYKKLSIFLYKEADKKLYELYSSKKTNKECSFAYLENCMMKENNDVHVWHSEVPTSVNPIPAKGKRWEVKDGQIRFVSKDECEDTSSDGAKP